jgi:methyl-accepting chemotaxis protein
MMKNASFGQKLGFTFAVMVALIVTIGVLTVGALDRVVEAKDRVIAVNAALVLDAERMRSAAERIVATARRYLLAREEVAIDRGVVAERELDAALAALRRHAAGAESGRLLRTVEQADRDHRAATQQILALRRGDTPVEAVARAYEEQVMPRRDALDRAINAFVTHEQALLDAAQRDASDTATSAVRIAVAIVLLGAAFALVVAVILTRGLSRQITSSVSNVRSSSTELQASANQQAMGARAQATAMSEISTTITELLATSRQIAESVRQVTQIAEQTGTAATSGQRTVSQVHEAIASIRRQVDVIVAHMLDLGRKSQQIGSVLEIVSELAEQTNILAINATIEAAGAGDAGRRFAVVADEIRRLAERVTSSTKEIRTLIDDVRGAVNTTVMATETGSKTVDAGVAQFATVTASFTSIASMVSTTTEAAREIELSTKQQTTAVEQVHIAIANVAQSTQETEASSTQTLQTVSQLTALSGDLMTLVQPEARA